MELWSEAHLKTLLPATIVMLVVAVILRLTIGKKPLHIRMIPIQIMAVVVVLLEIGKQVTSFLNGYDLYHIPLHYCSMLIFALPAMAFYKGKHSETVRAVAASLCMAMTLLTLIYPCLIYSAGNIENYWNGYLDFHTVTFHNLMIFATFCVLALDIYTPQPKGEQRAVILCVSIFCVISATMAQVLQTNYANYYSCNIPPLESVRLAVQATAGYVAAQLLYVLIVSVLNILFTLLSYWANRLVIRCIHPKIKEKTA